MVATRTVQYKDGRCEVVPLEPVRRAASYDNPLAVESSIMWLEPIERLDYVRMKLVRNCNSPRAALIQKGKGRIVGYSKLRDDAPTDPVTGGYVRRVFYLTESEIARRGSAKIVIPDGAIDPATIVPGELGQPATEKKKRLPTARKTRRAKVKTPDSPLDDQIVEWLNDSIAPRISSTGAAEPESQAHIETELAQDVPDDQRITTPGLGGSVRFGNLIPVNGGARIPLTKRKITAGRDPECDIVLDFSNVSGRHFELAIAQGYWFVKDLNSTNGVRVDGVLLSPLERTQLDSGAVLTIGKLQFKIQYSPGNIGINEFR